jgi:hypothetical protein
MASLDLTRSALITRLELGRPGVSVRAGVAVSDLDLMTKPERLEHRQMRKSTAGRVRDAGFEIEPTGERYHCTIYLPNTDNRTLNALVGAFDDPEPNPASGGLRA